MLSLYFSTFWKTHSFSNVQILILTTPLRGQNSCSCVLNAQFKKHWSKEISQVWDRGYCNNPSLGFPGIELTELNTDLIGSFISHFKSTANPTKEYFQISK